VGIRVGEGMGVSVEVGAGRVGSAVPNSGVAGGTGVAVGEGTQALKPKAIDRNRNILYNALALRGIPSLVIKSTSNYLVRSQ